MSATNTLSPWQVRRLPSGLRASLIEKDSGIVRLDSRRSSRRQSGTMPRVVVAAAGNPPEPEPPLVHPSSYSELHSRPFARCLTGIPTRASPLEGVSVAPATKSPLVVRPSPLSTNSLAAPSPGLAKPQNPPGESCRRGGRDGLPLRRRLMVVAPLSTGVAAAGRFNTQPKQGVPAGSGSSLWIQVRGVWRARGASPRLAELLPSSALRQFPTQSEGHINRAFTRNNSLAQRSGHSDTTHDSGTTGGGGGGPMSRVRAIPLLTGDESASVAGPEVVLSEVEAWVVPSGPSQSLRGHMSRSGSLAPVVEHEHQSTTTVSNRSSASASTAGRGAGRGGLLSCLRGCFGPAEA